MDDETFLNKIDYFLSLTKNDGVIEMKQDTVIDDVKNIINRNNYSFLSSKYEKFLIKETFKIFKSIFMRFPDFNDRRNFFKIEELMNKYEDIVKDFFVDRIQIQKFKEFNYFFFDDKTNYFDLKNDILFLTDQLNKYEDIVDEKRENEEKLINKLYHFLTGYFKILSFLKTEEVSVNDFLLKYKLLINEVHKRIENDPYIDKDIKDLDIIIKNYPNILVDYHLFSTSNQSIFQTILLSGKKKLLFHFIEKYSFNLFHLDICDRNFLFYFPNYFDETDFEKIISIYENKNNKRIDFYKLFNKKDSFNRSLEEYFRDISYNKSMLFLAKKYRKGELI